MSNGPVRQRAAETTREAIAGVYEAVGDGKRVFGTLGLDPVISLVLFRASCGSL
jgi:hypothetical protein